MTDYQAGWNMAGQLRDARASLREAKDLSRKRLKALNGMKLRPEEQEAIAKAIRLCRAAQCRSEAKALTRLLERMQ